MKRLGYVLTLVLALGFGLTFAQDGPKVPKFQVGLDTPTFGWPSVNAQGGITNSFGINMGLGISYRSYFEPLYPQSGSLYWEAGTFVLILPYLGVGYDYRFDEKFYVGGGVTFVPLLLLVGTWPLYPTVHLGVYLY